MRTAPEDAAPPHHAAAPEGALVQYRRQSSRTAPFITPCDRGPWDPVTIAIGTEGAPQCLPAAIQGLIWKNAWRTLHAGTHWQRFPARWPMPCPLAVPRATSGGNYYFACKPPRRGDGKDGRLKTRLSTLLAGPPVRAGTRRFTLPLWRWPGDPRIVTLRPAAALG